MLVIPLSGSEEFDSYDIEEIEKQLNADIFVYFYERDYYEGSGFAAWREGDKFGYTDLGHCSCYGPLESLNGAKAIYTFEELEEIAKKNYNDDYYCGLEVVESLKEIIDGQERANQAV